MSTDPSSSSPSNVSLFNQTFQLDDNKTQFTISSSKDGRYVSFDLTKNGKNVDLKQSNIENVMQKVNDFVKANGDNLSPAELDQLKNTLGILQAENNNFIAKSNTNISKLNKSVFKSIRFKSVGNENKTNNNLISIKGAINDVSRVIDEKMKAPIKKAEAALLSANKAKEAYEKSPTVTNLNRLKQEIKLASESIENLKKNTVEMNGMDDKLKKLDEELKASFENVVNKSDLQELKKMNTDLIKSGDKDRADFVQNKILGIEKRQGEIREKNTQVSQYISTTQLTVNKHKYDLSINLHTEAECKSIKDEINSIDVKTEEYIKELEQLKKDPMISDAQKQIIDTRIKELKAIRKSCEVVKEIIPPSSIKTSKENTPSEVIAEVKTNIESLYKFKGYEIPGLTKATCYDPFKSHAEQAMTCKVMEATTPGIGAINHRYLWNNAPSADKKPSDESTRGITNPQVRLPKGMTTDEYNTMRKTVQEAAVSDVGLKNEQAQAIAMRLGGVTIEATLPYEAGAILQDGGPSVNVHCIFQTGMNFGGISGGGIPITNEEEGSLHLIQYSESNARAALKAALENKSDALVFNTGIGAGFFGGKYADIVKAANVDGICVAAKEAKGQGIEIIVPDIGYTSSQRAKLQEAGITIVAGDKGAAAALCARRGLKVSETIAGDPMSMLGIHGPGFWWESARSASDEERIAFLTPSYMVGHMPIDIVPADGSRTKIAAISEYMVAPKPKEEAATEGEGEVEAATEDEEKVEK